MYRLLIVDDEMFIADGIKSSVSWERLGFADVLVAYNLRQAKEVFETYSIDLMICDIEMPQGSGLELVEWVRASSTQTECIFLTAHPNFDYAKKAIQLGSFEYLLKPIPKEELKDAVIRAIEKIRKDKEGAHFKRVTFWKDVLSQAIPSIPEQLNNMIRKLELPYLVSKPILPILIWLQHWDKSFNSRDIQILKYALKNALEESFIQENPSELLWINDEVILVIIPNLNGDQEELQRIRRKIKIHSESFVKACNTYFYCHPSCYIGNTAFLHEFRPMVETLIAFQKDYVNFTDRALFLDDYKIKDLPIPMPPFKIWSEMFKRGDHKKLIEESWGFLERWRKIEGLDAKWITHFYQSFMQMIMTALEQLGFRADEITQLSPARIQAATRSVKDLQEWMLGVLEAAYVHIKTGQGESVVEKTKKYIALHIEEELSRQCIADYIGLSPDYVVKVFKKETGDSINDYILKERIHMAKEMLANTDMTITSIAMSVGFSNNFPYFSTIFKKNVLMTPQEYRKSYRKKL
ncbi:response regulator [Paenibacillus sp. 37]|uniref:response regulator n=1 Tax=Paenibacillus sp. 37 TaxID=2607911 RepID=UPI00122DF6BA|nr:response regulator [Paenibacillus sp. 37]